MGMQTASVQPFRSILSVECGLLQLYASHRGKGRHVFSTGTHIGTTCKDCSSQWVSLSSVDKSLPWTIVGAQVATARCCVCVNGERKLIFRLQAVMFCCVETKFNNLASRRTRDCWGGWQAQRPMWDTLGVHSGLNASVYLSVLVHITKMIKKQQPTLLSCEGGGINQEYLRPQIIMHPQRVP